ncbi:MAG: TonB-dependent receptor [Cyclobacteriaceae bacterium]
MTKCAFYGLCLQMLCAGMLIASTSEAQKKSLQDVMLSVQLSDVELVRLFSELENYTNFNFAYNDSQIDEKQKLSLKVKNQSLYRVLRTISKETGLSFKRIDDNIFVQRKGESNIPVDDVNLNELADIQITGKIIDENSQGLPGASVVIKGTTKGTTTDLEGNYSLTAPDDATLVVSFVGYVTQEVLVGARSKIDLAMSPDAAQLEEIVVVGYGSQKKSDITGSTASVDGDQIAAMPVPTFDMALQGRAAGMLVTSTSGEPGGGVSIRIRGSNSVIGNNEPLIVLDGYPMPSGGEASNSGSNNNRGQGANLLSFLNPAEIESVDILKDASATAIYGSRGANGVIIVTTKKGKAGGAQVNITSETGFNEIPAFPELLDGPTYATWRNEVAVANGDNPIFDGSENRPLPQNATTTRWIDRILRTGVNQRVQFDASGGTESTRYFVSGNYLKNSGIVKFTDFSRGNIRLNLDTKLTERLSLTTTINYARSKNNRTEEGTGLIINSGAVFTAYKNSPTSTADDELDGGDGLSNFFADPLVQLRDNKDETYDESTIIGLQAKYNILDGLDFNVRTGSTSKNSRREIYWPNTTRVGNLVNGRAIYNNYNYRDMLLETYFTYNKALNEDHNLNLTGGYSWQENTERRLNTRVEDFPTDALTTDNIGFGLDAFIPTSQKLQRTLASFYFRSNYNFQNKYYLTLTGRADGSSVFSANKKWGIFPSAAVGWTISKESFMESVSSISNLKFRASYGITGTQSIRPLQSLTLLGVANAAIVDVLNAGLAPRQLGNPDLEWEKTKQLNIGLDMSLFADRVYANFDYYVKTTDDLLQNLPLPTSAGLSSIVSNAGSIENSGIEIVLGGYPVDKQDFKWNTNINWSANRSKIKSLGEVGADIFGPNPAVNIVNEPANIMRVGEVFGAFYGYQVLGLIQNSDLDADGNPTIPINSSYGAAGSWKFQDTDESGVVTATDRVVIGDPTPDFIFGWNNDLTYKAFTLSVFFQGVVGNDVMNLDRLFLASGRTANNALLNWYENRWTEDNQHNMERYPGNNAQNNLKPNSAVVEDGTYIRLKNVSLGYNIPTNNALGLRNARVYVTATNLFTITNYSGFDPEVNVFGGNNIGQGVDFGSYPRNRTYTLGVKLGF